MGAPRGTMTRRSGGAGDGTITELAVGATAGRGAETAAGRGGLEADVLADFDGGSAGGRDALARPEVAHNRSAISIKRSPRRRQILATSPLKYSGIGASPAFHFLTVRSLHPRSRANSDCQILP